MEDFKQQVKKGFQACKSDIEEVKEENNALRQDISELKGINKQLQEQISSLTSEIKGLHIALEHIKDMSLKVATSPVPQQQIVQPVVQEQPVAPKKTKQKIEDPYEALLAFKAKSNKKDLLKRKMLSMVGDGMNLSELKFMFVEHFRYSSKATFYNYLKELELESSVVVKREQSKNIVYLTNSLKNQI